MDLQPSTYYKIRRKIYSKNIEQTYTYLGIQIGITATADNKIIIKDMTDKLTYLSKALLKPQQRLILLTQHLIPSLLHKLTFTDTKLRTLNGLDCLVRNFTRRWLRLPKDTSLCVFHVYSMHLGGREA